MKYRKLKLSIVLFVGLGLTVLHAQETIPATGGSFSGSGGSASYSVGQVVYSTNTGPNGSLAEGVQQPYEISVITAYEEAIGIRLSVSVYPNPTTDYLCLSIDEFDISNLSYQLFDMQGKLLQNEKITDKLTSIVVRNLLPANYILKVIQGQSEVKIFKLNKTQ
jgi:hypothetical protein